MTKTIEEIQKGDVVELRLTEGMDESYRYQVVKSVNKINNLTIITYEDTLNRSHAYYADGNTNPDGKSIMDIMRIVPRAIAKPKFPKHMEDLVKISIPYKRLNNFYYRKVLKKCFNLREHEIPNAESHYDSRDFDIICNTDQFANFIIMRNNLSIQNLIKELDIQRIRPVIRFTGVEVWDRS